MMSTTQATPTKPRQIAKFRSLGDWSTVRAIRLYDDGTIRTGRTTGSVRGARANVDQSGHRRLHRDTMLTIEGPDVAIVKRLDDRYVGVVMRARKFAAEVNRIAAQLAETP